MSNRPVKFTPERLEQIRNLVERGMPREQIADTIGCTVGSLQVTCSRLGISLRRPKDHLLRTLNAATSEPQTGNGGGETTLTLTLSWRGRQRNYRLPLSPEIMQRLIIEASFRNKPLGDYIAELIIKGLK